MCGLNKRLYTKEIGLPKTDQQKPNWKWGRERTDNVEQKHPDAC